MDYILVASIVWVIFLCSNVIVGFLMYRLGAHGKLRKWSESLSDPVKEVSEKLGVDYIPGSEFDPFQTQHEPRYRYEEDEDGFMPDPVTPRGGEDDGEEQ